MADIATLGIEIDSANAERNFRNLAREATSAGRAVDGAGQSADRANKLFNQTAATTRALEALYQRIRSEMDALNQVQQQTVKHIGLSANEWKNLGFQVNDVATMLASGSSPFQVIATQGGQVYQILSGANGGVNGALRSIASYLGSVFTVGRVAFGGIAAGALAAATATNSYLAAQERVAMALTGAGRASGASGASINGVASQAASATGLSVSEARELAAALAATGKVANDNLLPIVKMGKDIATAFGTDAKGATEILARAFADPVAGADDLNQRLGFLDSATRRNITNLMAQNDVYGAQRVLMAGVKSGLEGVNETVSNSSKLWTILGNAVSNAWNATGEFLAKGLGLTESLEARLQRAQANLKALQDQSNGGRSAVIGSGMDLGFVPSYADEGEIAKAQAEVDKLTDAISRNANAAATAAAAQRSFAQEAAVRNLTPEIAQQEALNNQLKVLVDLMKSIGNDEAAGARLAAIGITFKQLADAVAKAQSNVTNFKSEFQQALDAQALQSKSLTAFSPSAKGDIAYQQRYNAEINRNVDATKAAALAEGDRAIAIKAAGVAFSEAARARTLYANQSVASAQLEIDMVGKTIGQQATMRANLQAYQTLEQQASQNRTSFDEAEYQRLKKINEELGKRVQQAALTSAQSQANFTAQTMFMSQSDLAAANVMHNLYGDEWQSHMDDALAKQIKMNEQLQQAQSAAVNFASSFVADEDGEQSKADNVVPLRRAA